MSLEFIGILPFLFLFILLLWQVVASGYGILTTQSAVSEAASVYSVTQNVQEAQQKAQDVVGSGDIITFTNLSIPSGDSQGNFKATINVHLNLIFLPNDWQGNLNIPFSLTTSSRVIDYEAN